MTRAQIREAARAAGFDRVTVGRDGTVTARRSFFYRHGVTAEKCADAVRRAFPAAAVLAAEERWAPWPRDSYWVVTFAPDGVRP